MFSFIAGKYLSRKRFVFMFVRNSIILSPPSSPFENHLDSERHFSIGMFLFREIYCFNSHLDINLHLQKFIFPFRVLDHSKILPHKAELLRTTFCYKLRGLLVHIFYFRTNHQYTQSRDLK